MAKVTLTTVEQNGKVELRLNNGRAVSVSKKLTSQEIKQLVKTLVRYL